VACLLGAVCFVFYLTNLRPLGAWDSIPARLLPFSILRQGNLDLDEFAWLRRLNPEPYFLRRGPSGHWLSRYPVGLPILVTPLYAPITWWLQHHHVDDDDVRFRLASVVMERIAAATVGAASVGFVFLAAAAISPTQVAVGVALAYGLGSSTWTVGSQALWQHGLAELGLAGLSFFLLAPMRRRAAAAAGAFAALGVLARPTMLVFALVALIFMWRERRAQLIPFLSLPILGAALLLAYNMRLAHSAVAWPRFGAFRWPRWASFFGLLVSPNRGLFIYTPAAALAIPAVCRPGRAASRWLAYAPFGVAGYLLLYSAWSGWWGGHCYGPRFLTDALPVIALCAVPAVERLWRSSPGRLLVLAMAFWGLLVQAIGAYCDDNSWNALPVSVDKASWRVWKWDDPQILRAARAGWHAFDLAPLLWQALVHPEPALLRPLDPGDLRGEITTDDPLPLHYSRQGSGTLHLRLTNRSDVVWPAFSDFAYLQVLIAYRWWLEGVVVQGEGGFIRLPRNLGPQESIALRAAIAPPSRSGEYQLDLVVIQAIDPTKGRFGDATLRVPVRVE
jgi:MFS family permease